MSVRAVVMSLMLRRMARAQMMKRTIEEHRQAMEEIGSRTPPPRGTVVETVQIGDMAADRLVPPGADPKRALLWFFGGGYFMGSPRVERGPVAGLAMALGSTALLPSYRLCPENPVRAGLEDALTVYRWLSQQVDPTQILVGGESAGGGMALRLLVAARNADLPMPAAAILWSPWTDVSCRNPSVTENAAKDSIFPPEFFPKAIRWVIADGDAKDPALSPLYADLHGLPPLLIQCAGNEMLRDDSVLFAGRAKAAGVEVKLHVYPGLYHSFQLMTFVPEAKRALAECAEFGRAHFGGSLRSQPLPVQ
jgi:monoterpene epsilon-lactone hydrolase